MLINSEINERSRIKWLTRKEFNKTIASENVYFESQVAGNIIPGKILGVGCRMISSLMIDF